MVTFDHEHVPTEHLHALEADGIAVRPGPEALVHAQDKGVMRAALDRLGVPCPRNAIVGRRWPRSRRSGSRACSRPPAAGTTARASGSSGTAEESAEAFATAAAAGVQILAEELVDFRRELSALVARSPSGQVAA